MNFSIFKKKKQKPDPELSLRGRFAAELLKSEPFHEVMEELERDIWEQFINSTADSQAARELLYTHINALKYIKEKLESYIQQGKLADHQIKQKGLK